MKIHKSVSFSFLLLYLKRREKNMEIAIWWYFLSFVFGYFSVKRGREGKKEIMPTTTCIWFEGVEKKREEGAEGWWEWMKRSSRETEWITRWRRGRRRFHQLFFLFHSNLFLYFFSLFLFEWHFKIMLLQLPLLSFLYTFFEYICLRFWRWNVFVTLILLP